MDQALSEMQALLRDIHLAPSETEVDDDDGVYTARWSCDGQVSFALTFSGNGFVVGTLVYADVKRRGEAWRMMLTDLDLPERIAESIREVVLQPTA